MPFRFTPTKFAEVMVVDPKVFPDERGFFMETYKRSDLAAHGITDAFVQTNQSRSSRGTLRGLHYQKNPKSQGKLVRTLSGEVFEQADILYMVTHEYAPECEAGIIWNDRDLRIDWPIAEPALSTRDKNWPSLRAADNNFQYQPQPPSSI